jgi:hypothetical protein
MRDAWAFVLLLLMGSVVCVSAIPQTDLPETSYNEVDTPVNQAPPVFTGIRFVRPAIARVILPKQVGEAGCAVGPQMLERKAPCTPVPHSPHSRQDFLCTFLI